MMPLKEYPFAKRYGWVQDRFGVSWQLMLTRPEGEPRPAIIPSQLFVNKVCGKAEEALDFYLSVFKKGRIGTVARYPGGMAPNREGTAIFAEAQLFDQWFVAMDSAADHRFNFNGAVSYSVECDDQVEVDHYWNSLTADGGAESMCGWLKDKYGFSWQIVPRRLGELLEDPDEQRANRTLQAMLKMKKLDIQQLERAADDERDYASG